MRVVGALVLFLLITFTNASFGADSAVFDNYLTRNGLDPSCRGKKIYNVVSIDSSGKQTVLYEYDDEFAYYRIPKSGGYTIDSNGKTKVTKIEILQYAQSGNGFSYVDAQGSYDNVNNDYFIQNKNFSSLGKNFVGVQSFPPSGSSSDPLSVVCVAGCHYAPHSLTGAVVNCVEGTMRNLFTANVNGSNATFFQIFQGYLKPIIVLLLILYLSFVGIRTLMGEGIGKDTSKTLIMLVIKVSFVMYFAVGDAWKDFFFDALKSLSSGVADIVYQAITEATYAASASNPQGVDGCMFKSSDYQSYNAAIVMFDRWDCMLGNSIGFFRDEQYPLIAKVIFANFWVPYYGWALVYLLIFYVTLIFQFAARITQLYLSSVIFLTLALYISPIIIPLCLFDNEYAKHAFKTWVDKVMVLSLYPVLAFLLSGLFISLVGSIIYGSNPVGDELFIDQEVSYSGLAVTLGDDASINVGTPLSIAKSVMNSSQNGGNTLAAGTYKQNPLQTPDTFVKNVNPNCNFVFASASYSMSSIRYSPACFFRRASQFFSIGLPVPGIFEFIRIPFPYFEDLGVGTLLQFVVINILLYTYMQIINMLEGVINEIAKTDTSDIIGKQRSTGEAYSNAKGAMNKAKSEASNIRPNAPSAPPPTQGGGGIDAGS